MPPAAVVVPHVTLLPLAVGILPIAVPPVTVVVPPVTLLPLAVTVLLVVVPPVAAAVLRPANPCRRRAS